MICPGAWLSYQYCAGLDPGRVAATLTYSRVFLKFHRGNQTVPHILIVGVGSIGQRHVENFLKVDGVRCSIAEMDETMRQRAIDQFPIEQAYDDFHDADLTTFDGVVICTPTNTHVRLATEVVSPLRGCSRGMCEGSDTLKSFALIANKRYPLAICFAGM